MHEHELSVSYDVAPPNEAADVVMAGRLVRGTAHVLQRSLNSLIGAGSRRVTVDLADVTELDAAGLAALVVAARVLSALGGSLRVKTVSQPCEEVMRRVHAFDGQLPPAHLS